MLRAVGIFGTIAAGLVSLPGIQSQPVFRASVELMQLDVTVLDGSRRPVTGLGPLDFEVLENGRRRPIASVVEVSVPTVAAPVVGEGRPGETASDIVTNQLPDGRLLVILMDDATIPPEPWTVNNAKKIAHGVVDRMGPQDLAAVVFVRDSKHAQGYTGDRTKLRAAIDRFNFGMAWSNVSLGWPPASEWMLYFLPSVRTAYETVALLERLPGRKKAVVYITTGVPLGNFAPNLSARVEGEMDRRESASAAVGLSTRLQAHAAKANVSVYPVDPAGLAGLEFFVLNRIPRVAGELYLTAVADRARLHTDYLLQLAATTGGRAIVNTNEFESGLDRMFEETSHYYLLTYEPTLPISDGRYRRLEVKTNRSGLKVITKRGYVEMPRTMAPEYRTTDAALTAALAGLLPRAELPLSVTVAALPTFGDSTTPVLYTLSIGASAGSLSGGAQAERISLMASAFTPDGSPVATHTYNIDFPAAGPSAQQHTKLLSGDMELKPGRYELRFSVQRPPSTDVGSVYAYVDVPDIRRGAFWSDAVVDLGREGVTALREGINPLPAIRRVFAQGDSARVLAVLVHDEELAPQDLAVVIRNDKNGLRTSVQPTRNPMAENGRVLTRVAVDIPVRDLEPGAYVLTFEATIEGRGLTRDLRFTIK